MNSKPEIRALRAKHLDELDARIQIGVKVEYSSRFLKSCFINTGPLPFAKGRVSSIDEHGRARIAHIDWTNDFCNELPARVLTRNLKVQGQMESD